MNITLTNLADTRRLGEALAKALSASSRSQVILLEGDLGAGKTTLARFLVESLPGGGQAEVSSPSFTLCNIYSTRPEIWHYDLYRLEYGAPPDEFTDALYYIEENPLEDPVFMLVEWPERLAPENLPASRIHCRLTVRQNDRRASFEGHGKAAHETLERLGAILSQEGGQFITQSE